MSDFLLDDNPEGVGIIGGLDKAAKDTGRYDCLAHFFNPNFYMAMVTDEVISESNLSDFTPPTFLFCTMTSSNGLFNM